MRDTDDDLVDLLLIPGIGRAKARALYAAGYRNAADIAKADPLELSKVQGIGPDTAREVIKFVSFMEENRAENDMLETAKELLICPMCGSMVSGSSNECSGCGITFSDEVEELDETDAVAGIFEEKERDGFWYKEQSKLFICPECGSLVSDGSTACPKCGVQFEEGEEEDLPEQPGAPANSDGYWYKEDSTLFMCPNCGSFIKKDADSCGSCGIVFETDEEEVAPEPEVCPMCKSSISPDTVTCEGCGFDFTKEKEKDGFWYKDQTELFMCPGCGAFIPRSASKCGMCGLALEEDGAEEPEAPECPTCKAVLSPGAISCSNCGFDFTVEKENDGFWYKDPGTLFICPGCGAFLSSAAESCLNCGLVFEEQDDAAEERVVPANSLNPNLEEQVDELIELVEIEHELESTANGLDLSLEKQVDELIELVEIEHELESTTKGEPGKDAPTEDDLEVPEISDTSDSLYLCPICGAFVQSSVLKCPACSTVFDDIGEMELEPVASTAVNTEELAREMAAEIREIETELLETPKKAERRGGVSKDFLDRWKKLDSGNVPGIIGPRKTPEADAKEIRELEEILVLDEPESAEEGLDGFWSEKARELAAKGRVDEAVAFLDRGVELNPEREMEYKRLMLELMGVGPKDEPVDLSELAAIDDIGELAVDEELLSQKNIDRLDEIDQELQSDVGSGALWQEKGELLEKLGRHEEAIDCFDRSIGLSYSELRKDQKSPAIRREMAQLGIGLTNGQGRVDGRVNGLLIQRGLVNGSKAGLTNGKVNGLVNGRINRLSRGLVNGSKAGLTNGKVNGLTNGRVNGLSRGRTNGRVNGLTNGRTNGLASGEAVGLVNGAGIGLINGGLVNGMGLVNGEGMVNGAGSFRRLRQRRRERMIWRHRLTAMVLLVALVLMVPMLGNLMLQEEGGRISIDGNFADWNGIQAYYNFMREDSGSPGMGILETRISRESNRLSLFVLFDSDAFSEPVDGVSSVWVMIDVDADANTGYAMQGMGVDFLAEIYGWDGDVKGSALFQFNGLADRDDWNGFYTIGSAASSCSGRMLEASINIPRDIAQSAQTPKVLVMAMDSHGNSSITSYLMSPDEVGAVAEYTPSGGDIIQPGTVVVWGQAALSAHSGDDAAFAALVFNITGNGASTDISDPILRMANGQMVPVTMSQSTGNGFLLAFAEPLVVPVNNTITLTLESGISSLSSGKAMGISLAGAVTDGAAARVRNMAKTYNVGIPSGIVIDGAFGDWELIDGAEDPEGDVMSPNERPMLMNSNIDIAGARFSISDDSLFFFLSVNGIMMGGESLPTARYRPGGGTPTQQTDSDRDTVPDHLDPHPFDFTNDGIVDSDMTTANGLPDVDGDGIADYPHGPDWWLNTTIPDYFPEPYAGRAVSIYIGPISTQHVEQKGDDRAYVLIDSDDDPQTGQNLKGGVGIDRVVIVSGKNNRILASEMYKYDPNQPTGWAFMGEVDAAVDWTRMEGAIDLPGLDIATGSNLTAYVSFEDWRGSYDVMEQATNLTVNQQPATGTRSPAGDNVVLNEIYAFGAAEWVELCNPTTSIISIDGWTLRRQGNGQNYPTIYTFPPGSIIGAFGGGSEYLSVSLNNQLVDEGRGLRLVNAAGTIMDFIAYPAAVGGSSYARLKNQTFGMPTDTDATSDWYVSPNPTQGGPNDRTAPIIIVAKSGSSSIVFAGGQIAYTIWYNNTGTGNARHVWVNDTLPAGVTYSSSSIEYSSNSGQTYGWHLSNVAPGNNYFTITGDVDSSLAQGTVLTNTADLDYTDQLSRPWGTSSDSFTATVSAPAPVLTLAKVVDNPTPVPGETVTFTIDYNNTGAASAPHVWLNDTLPAGMTYVSGNPAPTSVSGQNLFWYFQNVAVGSYSVTLRATVDLSVAAGTTLTNTATADYKNSAGASQPQAQAQVSVTVADAASSIVINEVVVLNPEWVEFCNPSSGAVDIGSWTIRMQAGQSGNYNIVATIPAGTVIGAFGSGSEYYVLDLIDGTLNDASREIRLYDAADNMVDATAYTAMAAGQSWARLKHEDTGKPVDTGSDANDFYLSNNAWIVPEGPTPGAPNDRKRPVMEVQKTVSQTTTEPGQTITYTVWYNNTGDGNAKNVWVNDTLPAGVDFISAIPAPASASGQSFTWYFPNVGHGTVSHITITAMVNSLPADGETVINAATIVYHDALRRPMGSDADWANFTCSRPVMTVEKVADVTSAIAGGTIVYTIYYNNTGSATAGSVWINDTLPAGVTFVSASPAPGTVSGQDLAWHLTNVAPGTHSITVTVTVDSDAAGTLTNWAYLDYSSGYGYGLESSSDSVDVVIPEMRNLALPVMGIMLMGLLGLKRRRDENGKDI